MIVGFGMLRHKRQGKIGIKILLASLQITLVLPSQVLEASTRVHAQDPHIAAQNPIHVIITGAGNCAQSMGCALLSRASRFPFHRVMHSDKIDDSMSARPPDDGLFEASKNYVGPRKGYVFKMGEQGLGYYRDADASEVWQGTSWSLPLSTSSHHREDTLSSWPPGNTCKGMVQLQPLPAEEHRAMFFESLGGYSHVEATDSSRSLWSHAQQTAMMESADYSGTDSWASSDSFTISGISKRREGREGRLYNAKRSSEKKIGPRLCKFEGGCTKLASFGDEGTRSPVFCKQVNTLSIF
jgi:hypothetical protein